MTRDEMIRNLAEAVKYLDEETQYATHSHERKVFRRWCETLEEIREKLVEEKTRDEDTDEQREFEERIEQLRREHDEMMRRFDEMFGRKGDGNA